MASSSLKWFPTALFVIIRFQTLTPEWSAFFRWWTDSIFNRHELQKRSLHDINVMAGYDEWSATSRENAVDRTVRLPHSLNNALISLQVIRLQMCHLFSALEKTPESFWAWISSGQTSWPKLGAMNETLSVIVEVSYWKQRMNFRILWQRNTSPKVHVCPAVTCEAILMILGARWPPRGRTTQEEPRRGTQIRLNCNSDPAYARPPQEAGS